PIDLFFPERCPCRRCICPLPTHFISSEQISSHQNRTHLILSLHTPPPLHHHTPPHTTTPPPHTTTHLHNRAGLPDSGNEGETLKHFENSFSGTMEVVDSCTHFFTRSE